MVNNLLNAALKYHDLGWSVIPLSPNSKIPPKDFKVMQYRDRLSTKEEIEGWWNENPNYNIAIITGKLSNLFVVDLDKHDPLYSEDTFLKYFPDSLLVPTVETPKGGQHMYFSYPKGKEITIGARNLPGIDFRGENGYILAPPSKNGNGKKYAWVVEFKRDLLCPPPADYINIISTFSSATRENTKSIDIDTTKDYIDYKVLQKGNRDQDLFTVANALVKNRVNRNFIEQILNLLAKSSTPPMEEREALAKIDSAIKRSQVKERNLADEVREWCLLQEGYFLTTELLQTLQITTKDEKKNLTVILTRLNKEGIIKKYGEKRGQYITIQKEEENLIDIETPDAPKIDIKLPFTIETLVNIMPKNIIVVAGEGNAGKTSFMLNFARLNRDKHKVFYFSSEMGEAELKGRLHNYDEKMPFSEWKKITFLERAVDFDAVIRPNDINIVDFLEVHDEFYKVGGMIKRIFDKLDKGIAVIALQKNIGLDYGLGGQRSLEKARLYLSMSPGKIKIVKAKNWVNGAMNPNGLYKEFKLAKGMIFVEQSSWKEE